MIDALVLVPQNIADTRDLGALDFRISRCDFGRQRADRFRDYLHCALDGALHVINGGIGIKRNSANRIGDALDVK
jgi:hypothetical protein